MMTNDFNESAHPRSDDGKFTPKTHDGPPGGLGALDMPEVPHRQFSMDGFYDEDTEAYSVKFDAVSYGEPWNGFATPVVTRETAEALFAALEAEAGETFAWDVNQNGVVTIWNPEYEDSSMDGKTDLVPDPNGNYDLAPLGMVFEEVEDDNPRCDGCEINDAVRNPDGSWAICESCEATDDAICTRCGVEGSDVINGLCEDCRTNPGCPACGLLDARRNVDGSWGLCGDCQADEDGHPRHSTTRDHLAAAGRRPAGIPGLREYTQRTGRELVRPFLVGNGAEEAHLVQRVDSDGLRMLVTGVDGEQVAAFNVKDETEALERFGALFGEDPVAKQVKYLNDVSARLAADERMFRRQVELNQRRREVGAFDEDDLRDEEESSSDLVNLRRHKHREQAHLALMQAKIETLNTMPVTENPYAVQDTIVFPKNEKES